MAHQPERKSFIPASGFRWLTAFYDPVLAHLLREGTWKAALVEQVAPQAGERILDLGCGTGTLSVLIKKAAPSAEVVGLDPDPEVLKRARHKAESAGLAISWQQGFADQPGKEGDCDKVVSSLMFHHSPPRPSNERSRASWTNSSLAASCTPPATTSPAACRNS